MAGPSVEADEDFAKRLDEEERERQRCEQNDEAIARQLAQLDIESAAALPAGAPAPEVGMDETIARQLHEEEVRAQQEAQAGADRHGPPPIASAIVLGPEAGHRFVSDLEDVVGQICAWIHRRMSEALDEPQRAPAGVPAAAEAGVPAAPLLPPPPPPARAACTQPPPSAPAALYATPEGYGDAPALGGASLGGFEVELVSFGDPAYDPLQGADAVRMDAELEELLLGRLCSLLHAMLADGLAQPLLGGLFQGGARSPWSLLEAWAGAIEGRCESLLDEQKRAQPSACLIGLLKAVQRVGQLYDGENGSAVKRAEFPPASELKFRALVCYGLNVGELHEWFSMLPLDGPAEQLFDWYEQGAFVQRRETVLLAAEKLVPLASHPFRLPLQLEVRAITRDSALYGWSAMQPTHSWL